MYLVDAQNALRTALADYARARGLREPYVAEYVSYAYDAADDYCADALEEQTPDQPAEAPLDTPSLDTSFHDHEMDVG